MFRKSLKLQPKTLWLLAIGFVAGLLWFSLMRIALIKSNEVHYHANFALYINGKKDDFKSFTFYEEVQSCDADSLNNPKSRVHMHNFEAETVHIHDYGATWAHFFSNLGYTLSDTSISTVDGTFINSKNDNHLTFYLNGKVVDSIANSVIGNQDTLLINYGRETEEELHSKYDDIPRTAAEHNTKSDPSSCSGGRPLTIKERLKRTFDFTN